MCCYVKVHRLLTKANYSKQIMKKAFYATISLSNLNLKNNIHKYKYHYFSSHKISIILYSARNYSISLTPLHQPP